MSTNLRGSVATCMRLYLSLWGSLADGYGKMISEKTALNWLNAAFWTVNSLVWWFVACCGISSVVIWWVKGQSKVSKFNEYIYLRERECMKQASYCRIPGWTFKFLYMLESTDHPLDGFCNPPLLWASYHRWSEKCFEMFHQAQHKLWDDININISTHHEQNEKWNPLTTDK